MLRGKNSVRKTLISFDCLTDHGGRNSARKERGDEPRAVFTGDEQTAAADKPERIERERTARTRGLTRIDAGTKVVIPPPRAMASA